MFTPPSTQSDVCPDLVLAVFGVLALAGAVYAVAQAARLRDAAPVLVCAGALLCAFNEPVYDILGKITYADDHPMAYELMGREIPWFLVLGYLPWVGVAPWVLSRRMVGGVSRRSLHLFAAATFVSVVAVESLGTALDAWTYYAVEPIKWLVVAPQMSVVPLLGAFLLFAIEPWARGWRRILVIVPPLVALPATYAATSWPMYVAAYGDMPPGLRWLSAGASMGLMVLAVLAIAAATERWHAVVSPSAGAGTASGDALVRSSEPRSSGELAS